MVSISPFVNKTLYLRLFTGPLLRQMAQCQLSGGGRWVVHHCISLEVYRPKWEPLEITVNMQDSCGVCSNSHMDVVLNWHFTV